MAPEDIPAAPPDLILQFFDREYLPESLHEVSAPFGELIHNWPPRNPTAPSPCGSCWREVSEATVRARSRAVEVQVVAEEYPGGQGQAN